MVAGSVIKLPKNMVGADQPVFVSGVEFYCLIVMGRYLQDPWTEQRNIVEVYDIIGLALKNFLDFVDLKKGAAGLLRQ